MILPTQFSKILPEELSGVKFSFESMPPAIGKFSRKPGAQVFLPNYFFIFFYNFSFFIIIFLLNSEILANTTFLVSNTLNAFFRLPHSIIISYITRFHRKTRGYSSVTCVKYLALGRHDRFHGKARVNSPSYAYGIYSSKTKGSMEKQELIL